jgi:hypothetical protein
MNKYHAKKTTLCLNCGVNLENYTCKCADPYTFDSKREAARYQELLLMMKAGEVKEIGLQPGFVLLDGYEKNGKKVRPIVYRADFTVYYTDGRVEVEDVKGYKTKEFRLKEKLFNAKYDEELKLV